MGQTDRASITVFVNDGSGNGFSSAHVTIIPLGTPMPWPMKFETGKSGEIVVRLKLGEYVVKANAPDCGSATTHITVQKNNNEIVPVVLRRPVGYCTVLAPAPLLGPIQMGPCHNWVQD
jgi:hypothetical protein